MEKPYRILSLDGGGSWALLQIMALQEIYGKNATGYDIITDFDLIAANSGGSITLGGLLTGRTLDDVLCFFLDRSQRKKVFSPLPFDFVKSGKPLRSVWNLIMRRLAGVGAKYRTQDKFDGLRDILQPISDKTLSEKKCG